MHFEDLNAKAKAIGLHVATAKTADTFTIRDEATGKLIAKDVTAAEALDIIERSN